MKSTTFVCYFMLVSSCLKQRSIGVWWWVANEVNCEHKRKIERSSFNGTKGENEQKISFNQKRSGNSNAVV